ncbi:hypothetical protein [Halobacillus sp. Marseille-P3879]|uniref:hypothetical protein n=1 Tax=Halobacillus sp. Marseille-P3879 TaxID=2045014 RepID=UPI000C7C66FE|nr:hypothetical protein [Halobacillus sp. Marseille-P3879]
MNKLDMEIGDIIFVRGKSPVSFLVRLFDQGEFSHVALMISNTHCIESQWNTRVRIVPMEFNDYEVVRIPLSDIRKDMIVRNAASLTGRWYDYRQIISYLIQRPWNAPNAYICSEIITTLLFDKDMVLKPNELYRYIIENELNVKQTVDLCKTIELQ